MPKTSEIRKSYVHPGEMTFILELLRSTDFKLVIVYGQESIAHAILKDNPDVSVILIRTPSDSDGTIVEDADAKFRCNIYETKDMAMSSSAFRPASYLNSADGFIVDAPPESDEDLYASFMYGIAALKAGGIFAARGFGRGRIVPEPDDPDREPNFYVDVSCGTIMHNDAVEDIGLVYTTKAYRKCE